MCESSVVRETAHFSVQDLARHDTLGSSWRMTKTRVSINACEYLSLEPQDLDNTKLDVCLN